LLQEAYPEQNFEPPPPPAQVQAISPTQAKQMLEENSELTVLDIREPDEREYAKLERSQVLDHKLAEEILNQWDPDSTLLLMCHRVSGAWKLHNFLFPVVFNRFLILMVALIVGLTKSIPVFHATKYLLKTK